MPQHRANPIADTMESIPGFPDTLRIYQIPASSYWQMRAYVAGKLVKRSSKTEEKGKAIKAAKEFYNELLLKAANHIPITSSGTFEKAANALLEEDKGRVERGERKQSLVKDLEYILKSDLMPFFKNDNVKNINYDRISAYVKRLQDRKAGSNTIKNHFIFLRKVLKQAWKLGLIDKLPIFPTISTQDNPREWFSSEQYAHLRKTIKDCIGQTPEKAHQPITDELRFITTFLVNTFLRPPDLKDLKNKDVVIVGKGDKAYLRIQAKSKVAMSPVVSMPAAVGIYKDWTEFNKKLGFGNPDDYVFYPALKDRGYAFQTLRLHFNHVLEKAGLKAGEGAPRTLYSLRHTAIMFRLLNGGDIDLLTLARNCRTSVDMLERFYAKHLQAEMRVEQLHSMKKR